MRLIGLAFVAGSAALCVCVCVLGVFILIGSLSVRLSSWLAVQCWPVNNELIRGSSSPTYNENINPARRLHVVSVCLSLCTTRSLQAK